jgi:chromatin remodeling complex protein RSC6
MNNNTADNNTMNTATKTAAKRSVAKKTETVTVTVAATPAAATPVAAAEVKAKVAKKAAPAKTETPVAVATTPVAAAAPEAQAVAPAAAPVKTVSEEVAALTKEINDARETLRKSLVALKAIEKRHGQELKEAKKRRRVKKEVDGEAKPARPSVFTTPVLLKESLATLLGKPKGTMMSPADVTRAIKVYINEHNLKGEKHDIHPDARMCEVLGLKAGDTLTYKNIQKYLYQLYEKRVPATTA